MLDMCELPTAERLARQALELRQRTLGNDHPEVRIRTPGASRAPAGPLPGACRAPGDALCAPAPLRPCAPARSLHQPCARPEPARRLHPPPTPTPQVGHSLGCLAEVLSQAGGGQGGEEARGKLKQAISIYAARLGPNHPQTQRAKVLLARMANGSSSALMSPGARSVRHTSSISYQHSHSNSADSGLEGAGGAGAGPQASGPSSTAASRSEASFLAARSQLACESQPQSPLPSPGGRRATAGPNPLGIGRSSTGHADALGEAGGAAGGIQQRGSGGSFGSGSLVGSGSSGSAAAAAALAGSRQASGASQLRAGSGGALLSLASADSVLLAAAGGLSPGSRQTSADARQQLERQHSDVLVVSPRHSRAPQVFALQQPHQPPGPSRFQQKQGSSSAAAAAAAAAAEAAAPPAAAPAPAAEQQGTPSQQQEAPQAAQQRPAPGASGSGDLASSSGRSTAEEVTISGALAGGPAAEQQQEAGGRDVCSWPASPRSRQGAAQGAPPSSRPSEAPAAAGGSCGGGDPMLPLPPAGAAAVPGSPTRQFSTGIPGAAGHAGGGAPALGIPAAPLSMPLLPGHHLAAASPLDFLPGSAPLPGLLLRRHSLPGSSHSLPASPRVQADTPTGALLNQGSSGSMDRQVAQLMAQAAAAQQAQPPQGQGQGQAQAQQQVAMGYPVGQSPVPMAYPLTSPYMSPLVYGMGPYGMHPHTHLAMDGHHPHGHLPHGLPLGLPPYQYHPAVMRAPHPAGAVPPHLEGPRMLRSGLTSTNQGERPPACGARRRAAFAACAAGPPRAPCRPGGGCAG
jgi:hypothetical protein